MDHPETRFASLERDRIAYVAFGDGPTDLLHIKPLSGSVDMLWEHVAHLRIWRTARPHLRLIMFDHRGTGMSDTRPEDTLGTSTIESPTPSPSSTTSGSNGRR